MFKCLFCGLANSSETARFCTECGPNGPAKGWGPEEIDQNAKITQYVSMLGEFYFEEINLVEVEKRSIKIRERLRISHQTHSEILSKFEEKKKAISHLSNLRFEFNENVINAYAGHDTFLDFRCTNLSEDDPLRVSLVWDDPETTDRVDFRAETKGFIKPLETVTVGGKAIFDRIGLKEISDLQLTISDQFGESATFRAKPFRFIVSNHDLRITQNISTHNQISIEGRAVVDASGMGAGKSVIQTNINNEPKWKELAVIFIPDSLPVPIYFKTNQPVSFTAKTHLSEIKAIDFIDQVNNNLKTLPVVSPNKLAAVNRNDPCPCGSGNKFKLCHGSIG